MGVRGLDRGVDRTGDLAGFTGDLHSGIRRVNRGVDRTGDLRGFAGHLHRGVGRVDRGVDAAGDLRSFRGRFDRGVGGLYRRVDRGGDLAGVDIPDDDAGEGFQGAGQPGLERGGDLFERAVEPIDGGQRRP
ncbi:MAG: hypothetical protein M5U14_09630 [Acidimicrobiia bacterium]|nr:hypothetical protein [Acidimicrobiia bacterium]